MAESIPEEPDTPPELDIDDIKEFMGNGWTLKSLGFDKKMIKQLLKNKEIKKLHNESKRGGGYKQGRKKKNKTQRRKTKRRLTKRQTKRRLTKRLKTKRRTSR